MPQRARDDAVDGSLPTGARDRKAWPRRAAAASRTTRSVAPTEAGERLLRTAGPRLDEIDAELAALSELRGKAAGNIRITAGEHSANTVLWPALAKLLPSHPDIKVEIVIDYGLTDIVA